MARFAGSTRAYGTYDLTKQSVRSDGKRQGDGFIRHAPVTPVLWERHLQGIEPGIGIIPIREDSSCTFGAIDVDVYQNFSHQEIVQKLARNNIPMVVVRTKSGGTHIYVFAKLPVAAGTMRSKLGEVASLLGFGDCEIFPKQSELLVERGDTGGFLNSPYFGGIRGLRYAVDIDGNAMSPEQFLEYAEKVSVGPEWFSERIVVNGDFRDGPPCLQALSQVGFPEGTRNNALVNIAVFLKKSQPDNWKDELENYNRKYLSPPLTLQEVQGVAKSVSKKDYAYSCSKQPVCSACDASLCRTRKFGVGGPSGRFPLLGGLTKLDTKPAIWFWNVNDVRIELSTPDLQDPRAFQRRCMEALNTVVSLPSKAVWEAAVNHAMTTVMVIDAPPDASPDGQLWEMVEKFCTGRAQALSFDEIVLGKPFSSGGRTYFRMADLMSYLAMHKFTEFKSQKVSSLLRDAGAEHDFKIIKGRGVNFWHVAEFAKQAEGYDVPRDVEGGGEPF